MYHESLKNTWIIYEYNNYVYMSNEGFSPVGSATVFRVMSF